MKLCMDQVKKCIWEQECNCTGYTDCPHFDIEVDDYLEPYPQVFVKDVGWVSIIPELYKENKEGKK